MDYLEQETRGSDDIAQAIYQKYENKHSIKFIYERQSRFIIEYLKKLGVRHVCDLGCGFGNFLVHAKDSFSQVSGIDPGPESLRIARQLIPEADLRIGQGENMPFEENELDSVVMKGVVHHLKNPMPVFQEAYRCLKPGGILLIFEGNRSSIYRQVVLGIANALRINHETTLFEHRSPELMRKMLEKSGFNIANQLNISGLFTPLALTGMGSPALWNFLFSIENKLQKSCPSIFNYHVMIAAEK